MLIQPLVKFIIVVMWHHDLSLWTIGYTQMGYSYHYKVLKKFYYVLFHKQVRHTIAPSVD